MLFSAIASPSHSRWRTGDCVKILRGHSNDVNTMFGTATELSQSDVSSVKDMNSMFIGAISFNGDLSKWDVSNVEDMSNMFWEATLFKQELCGPAWVTHRQQRLLYSRAPPG